MASGNASELDNIDSFFHVTPPPFMLINASLYCLDYILLG